MLNVRSSGTNAPSSVKSWLPVPHSPDTDHVSMMSTLPAGSTITRSGGGPARAVDQAVGHEPVGVLAAAGERPASRHPVAAVDRRGHPGGVEGPRRRRRRAHWRRWRRTWRPAADRRRPAPRSRSSRSSRPIRPPVDSSRISSACSSKRGAVTAVAAGHEHPEAAGGAELRHEVGGQAPGAFDLLGPGRDGGGQRPGGLQRGGGGSSGRAGSVLPRRCGWRRRARWCRWSWRHPPYGRSGICYDRPYEAPGQGRIGRIHHSAGGPHGSFRVVAGHQPVLVGVRGGRGRGTTRRAS